MEKIQCPVCDTDNYHFLTTCSECGARLRRVKRKTGPKKKNRKKIEAKAKKKEMSKCRGNKQTYPKYADAAKASRGIFQKKGRMSKIYKCGTCKGYHLTKLRSKS